MIITINIKDNKGVEAKEINLSMDRDFDRLRNMLKTIEVEENFCEWCGDIITGEDEHFCSRECAGAANYDNKEAEVTNN